MKHMGIEVDEVRRKPSKLRFSVGEKKKILRQDKVYDSLDKTFAVKGYRYTGQPGVGEK